MRDQLALYDTRSITLPLQFTRGCVYGRCTYCTYPAVELTLRGLRADDACATITRLVAEHDIRRFSLKDSLFSAPMLEQLGRSLLDADVAIEWSATTKVVRGLVKLAPLLAQAGLRNAAPDWSRRFECCPGSSRAIGISLMPDLQAKRCDECNGAMDLTGQLSNPPEPLARLLSILSRPTARTKRRSTRPNRSGYVEGRRRFGSVGKAVLSVLAAAGRNLTAHEIRLEVEKLLGGPISPHSISYQLQTRSKGSKPTIIQTDRRYYRLA